MEEFAGYPWGCDFGNHPVQSPLIGILIENRDHKYLEATLRNFSCMLPFASLWIMHSDKNKETIDRLVGPYPNIKTECCLPNENFTVKECDMMKMSPEFWKKFVQFHRLLIFNVDTGIKKNTILRFMHFDYIGAMWYHRPLGLEQGNGGFSLRNPRLMLEICTKFKEDAFPPEDVFFAQKIKNHCTGARMPQQFECELFSTETREIPRTFGFHDVETYFPDSKNVYVPIDNHAQALLTVHRADIDGIVNVTPLVKLGIGPSCLRLFKETQFSPGKILNIDGKSFPLENGRLVHDVVLRPSCEFHVYYRFSDHNNGDVEKDRPNGFCKRRVFENFLNVFKGARIHVIADRVSEDTSKWLRDRIGDDVEMTSIGNGGDTFCWAIRRAIQELGPTDIVYLCEDDYWHRTGSQKIIEEGLDVAEYVTLYDHPDKYISNGPNPFVIDEGEKALIRKTGSCHWKFTNSTTLTFASRVGTLVYDQMYHEKWCAKGKSLDFNLFVDLLSRGRTLASSLPGYSTHLQPPWVDKSFESCFSETHTSP
jgi:hypothetical protein